MGTNSFGALPGQLATEREMAGLLRMSIGRLCRLRHEGRVPFMYVPEHSVRYEVERVLAVFRAGSAEIAAADSDSVHGDCNVGQWLSGGGHETFDGASA